MKSVAAIDDDEDALALIGLNFEKAGAQVQTFSSPEKGLEHILANKNDLDLVVLDINMPGLGGNEIAKKIREAGYSKKLVALTGAASIAGKRHSTNLGFDTYLNKKTLTVDLAKALLA